MKNNLQLLILLIALAFCLISCNTQADTDTKESDEANDSAIYDDHAEDIIISNEFDPDAKEVEYKNLPNFGYKDGLYLIRSASDFTIDDSQVDENGLIVCDDLHIDGSYVEDMGDCGLVLDYEAIAEDYLINYNKATRRSGDFIITDFEDGVCINEYVFDKAKVKNNSLTVDIPETIDGRKVLKLGGACKKVDILNDYLYVETGFLLNVPSGISVTVKIPRTVRDICCSSLYTCPEFTIYDPVYSTDPEIDENAKEYSEVVISNYIVDKDNPYYSSKDGSLYNKDMDWLLCVRAGMKEFVVPDNVRYIAGEALDFYSGEDDLWVTIGENVKKIYGIPLSDAKEDKLVYKVKKGSAADKYLHSEEIADEKHIEYFE